MSRIYEIISIAIFRDDPDLIKVVLAISLPHLLIVWNQIYLLSGLVSGTFFLIAH